MLVQTHMFCHNHVVREKIQNSVKTNGFVHVFVIYLLVPAVCAFHVCTQNILKYKVFCALGADKGLKAAYVGDLARPKKPHNL